MKKTLLRVVGTTALVLAALLAASLASDEMNWGPVDFALAGGLMIGAGFLYALVSRGGNAAHRAAAALALATAFLLIWISLAVGIIGSEDNRANLMYVGVLAVGLIGSFAARLRPRGMARALFATALAHAALTIVAAFIAPAKTLVLNLIFVALWTGSGLLFRRASSIETDK